ncbi:MAG: hypothetical protein DYH20_02415 [Gammaproteobacteria bacterium PRO9]|nr:hypothetical protein [Gammaproteobacteria bacterium PRO9]
MSAVVGGIGEATGYSAPADRANLLRHVAIVTHCVPDLAAAVAGWEQFLGYRVVAEGTLDAGTGMAWDCAGAIGQRCALLEPESGQPTWIRFIESPDPGGYGPPMTMGWNATELLVKDVDALAARLRRSPFRIIGGPNDLYPRPRAPRAMQVIGPSGELVYFTRLLPGGSRYGLHGARSEVDRVFIVTTGGPSSDAMHDFYGGRLGLRILDRTPFLNPIVAHGCGLPPDTIFPTSIARIPGRSFLLEMDEYPATVRPRLRFPNRLPPGMAMVSFLVHSLDGLDLPTRRPAFRLTAPPFAGHRAVVIEGPAGEWLELIEAAGGPGASCTAES